MVDHRRSERCVREQLIASRFFLATNGGWMLRRKIVIVPEKFSRKGCVTIFQSSKGKKGSLAVDFRFESKCSECDQLGDKFRRWGTRLTCFLQSRSYAISSWYFLDWNVAHSCNFYFEKYNRFWIKYCIMWRIISAEIYIILKIISYS